MTWRLAKSLEVLRTQVNNAYPHRSKTSDGTIGDEAHASRSSDHNPWVKDGSTGIVTAMDITHDPKTGVDSYKLAETLRLNKDKRIKYIISNKRICSSTTSPWTWRPYTGSNPHNKHVHVSVLPDKGHYDSAALWNIGQVAPVIVVEPVKKTPSPMPKEEVVNHPQVVHGEVPTKVVVQVKTQTFWEWLVSLFTSK